jgi:transcriptional regulator with XRE-family HTH domain
VDRPAETLAERLDLARRARGLSRRQLAIAANVNPSLIGLYLKEKLTNPKLETLTAFAAALRVSQRWLSTGHGDMDDPADIPVAPTRKVRTYGTLPGWDVAEAGALSLVPHLDWALVGVRGAKVDEEPRVLTPTWVAYRAEVFSTQEHSEETRIALDRQATQEQRQREEDARSLLPHLGPASDQGSAPGPAKRSKAPSSGKMPRR